MMTTMRTVKKGEKCYIHDDPGENIDGSELEKFIVPTLDRHGEAYDDMASYVTMSTETEECNLFESAI